MTTINNDKHHYSAKPPVLGDKFDFYKDIIESFFLDYDADLWDMVIHEYIQTLIQMVLSCNEVR